MQIKKVLFLIIFASLVSCATNSDLILPENLQEYIAANSNRTLDNVIACAASDDFDFNTSYIFYYPITGAAEISYFETESSNLDSNDLSLYTQKDLPSEPVFNGELERFVKNSDKEVWCIVTFKTDGKLHTSNPIRLKNSSKPTEWTSTVDIEYPQTSMPKFSWIDGAVTENAIYFQVISDQENNFISGTYTHEKTFQYYDTSNVVLTINRSTPPNLIVNNIYNFTMMGVSEDNWVNLLIQKSFTVK